MPNSIPSFKIVIPARYASQRLPGKPLLKIGDKTMLEHVHLCAEKTRAQEIVVATDDERIANVVRNFGGKVCMTSATHPTGTDRIAEVAERFNWQDDDIVVNLQGDEPLMPAKLVNQVAQNLYQNSEASIATLCADITDIADLSDPSKVKVVCDHRGMAMYFSRSAIPFTRQDNEGDTTPQGLRHIGLYAYRVNFLKSYTQLTVCDIEQYEKLEQLRALYHGYKIHVDIASELAGQDVNTESDLQLVEETLLRRSGGEVR